MAQTTPSRRSPAALAQARVDRRAELLAAAVTVIRRDGPSASMEAIAKQAGITKPILYRHFDNRDGLVAALAEQFGQRLTDLVNAGLDLRLMPAPPTPRTLLHHTIDTYIAFIEADPGLYTFLTERAARTAASVGATDRVAQSVARALGEGLRSVGYDTLAAEPWSYGIIGLVHLAGERWVRRPSIPRAQLVDYLTDLLWSGLSSALEPLEDHER
jgi:AcrR family transcriptional regulator